MTDIKAQTWHKNLRQRKKCFLRHSENVMEFGDFTAIRHAGYESVKRRYWLHRWQRRQAMHQNVNTEARSCNNIRRGKGITYSGCYVCSLRYPACRGHGGRLSSVARLALQCFFPNYLINGKIFGGRGKVFNIKCALRFCLEHLCETFLILRIQRDITNIYIYTHIYMSSIKVPFNLVRWSLWNLNFLDTFTKNTQIPNFIKIPLVGAELCYADGRTWRTLLQIFANAPLILSEVYGTWIISMHLRKILKYQISLKSL